MRSARHVQCEEEGFERMGCRGSRVRDFELGDYVFSVGAKLSWELRGNATLTV